MNPPLVTIITPTKNRLLLLQEAMASVVAQTFSNWEHLIVDDGSEDGSIEIVEKIALSDSRIRLIKRTGGKPGANVCRNMGIRESRGEFMVFLDSDDLLSASCLENRVALMERNRDLDFAVFQTGFFVETPGDRHQQKPSEMFGDDLRRFLSFEFPWIINAPIWRKSALEKLRGFDETLPSWQDVDLHIRAICRGLLYVKVPVLDHHVRWQYEEDKVSVLQRRSPKHLQAASVTLAKFENEIRLGPGLDWIRQRALVGLYFLVAELWVDTGSLSSALVFWGESLSRGLASKRLHASGYFFLLLMASPLPRSLSRRIIHKWKGFARFRINPELVG
jgi:hypothetical protein